MQKRVEWIDALRALAMIFVIYGHMYQSFKEYLLFTSPIKIPLFFAVSGYLFSIKDGKIWPRIKKLFIAIMVPYFFLTLFPFKVIYAAIPSTGLALKECLYMFFSGEYLWYLPCCFFAEIIFFLVLKYSKKQWQIAVTSVLLTGLGLTFAHFDIGTFLYMSNALISQLFLLIGYLIRHNEEKFDKIGLKEIIILIIVYVGIGIYSMYAFPKECLSAHENRYYNIPICFSMIVIGCIVCFAIFKKFNISNKQLVFIGQNTLTYYAFNKYIRSPIIVIFGLMGITFPLNWWTGILLTVVCCIICWPISLLLNKFFPLAVGKKKKKKPEA